MKGNTEFNLLPPLNQIILDVNDRGFYSKVASVRSPTCFQYNINNFRRIWKCCQSTFKVIRRSSRKSAAASWNSSRIQKLTQLMAMRSFRSSARWVNSLKSFQRAILFTNKKLLSKLIGKLPLNFYLYHFAFLAFWACLAPISRKSTLGRFELDWKSCEARFTFHSMISSDKRVPESMLLRTRKINPRHYCKNLQ